MTRFPAAFLLAMTAAIAWLPTQAQTARPGATVRVNPSPSDAAPSQPDKAFRPAERDRAMAERPSNGCECESNNRCSHSLEFNYCIDKNGNRVYLQRFWGQ